MLSNMRTLVTRQPSYSEGRGLELFCPVTWHQLTQEQLRYVLKLLVRNLDPVEVKIRVLCAFSGLRVRRKLQASYKCEIGSGRKRRIVYVQAWQVQSMFDQLGFIDRVEDTDVRLEIIGGCHAVDLYLHGMSFRDYLMCERFYQLFLIHRKDEFLDKLASYLYVGDKDHWELSPVERLGTFMWFTHVKKALSENFRHLFQSGDESENYDLIASMNAQIRALTDGDVTREEQVLNVDCWRALTELDCKVRDAEAHERALRKMKNV